MEQKPGQQQKEKLAKFKRKLIFESYLKETKKKRIINNTRLSFTFWSVNFFRRAEQIICGYWIRLTRNARNSNARSGKIGSSHCYLNVRPLHEIDEIVYEYDRKQFHRLVYVAISRVIFNTLFNIIRVCSSRYVLKILFKKLKKQYYTFVLH